MVLEFDPQCGTAQVEDTLQLYVPNSGGSEVTLTEPSPEEGPSSQNYWPIWKKFHGSSNWPKSAIVIPGNEVVFSLETASDYIKDEKSCFYGFKCVVVGYEWNFTSEEVCLYFFIIYKCIVHALEKLHKTVYCKHLKFPLIKKRVLNGIYIHKICLNSLHMGRFIIV